MASWLQTQIRAAEGILEAVDRTAKHVSHKEQNEEPQAVQNRPSEDLSHQPKASSSHKPSESVSNKTKKETVSQGRLPSEAIKATSERSPQGPPRGSFGDRGSSSAQSSANTPFSQPLDSKALIAEQNDDQPPLASLFGSLSPKLPDQSKRESPASVREARSDIPEKGSASHIRSPTTETRPEANPTERDGLLPRTEPSGIRGSHAAPGPGTAPDQHGNDIPTAHLGSSSEASKSSPQGVPQSTADAVTEAIKAATAATGSQDGEEVDGPLEPGVREARLAKMVENLRRRLEQLKAENVELEEMLSQADANASGRKGDIGRLEDALAAAQSAEGQAQARILELDLKSQAELRSKESALEALRARRSELQSRVTAAEEENQKLLQNREMGENRMLTALREEVASTERRLEDERFGAAAARQSFAAREQELEATLSESAASLTKQQRALEDKARRLTAAEDRAAGLESEVADLHTQLAALQEMPAREAEGGDDGPERQELQEKISKLQAALGTSERQRQLLEQDVSRAQGELQSLQYQAARSISPAEAEQRLQEMTDLLYQKQSQLEKLAAERAAQQMSWERELGSLRDDAERSRRRVKTDRAMTLADGDLVVPMEDMESYQRLANHKRVGGAVKAGARFLDATTLTTVRFLRQYPLVRLAVFGYIVFIHLFIFTLIHNLQQHALHATAHAGLRLDESR